MDRYRIHFPQIQRQVYDRPLVYLDSAATTLKPDAVIERVTKYYQSEVANIHRGAHYLGNFGTLEYEKARQSVASFIGAASPEQIVFTRGTTEGMNLIAQCLSEVDLGPKSEILISEMEHHSNIVPWQLAAQRHGFVIKAIRVTDTGELDIEDFHRKLSANTRVVSLVHCSNALGTLNPLADLLQTARSMGAVTVVDAAQSVGMGLVDVQKLNCDFLAFSGHKLFAPTGIGVVYGAENWLNRLPPYQGGGSMISEVHLDSSTYLAAPYRFEAGTPNISGALGLGAAIEWLGSVNWEEVRRHEQNLRERAELGLKQIPGLRLIGESPSRLSIVSFVMEGLHSSDVGQILDKMGIAVRAGHHCCQPLMRRFNVSGTIRASFSIYSTEEEVDLFLAGVHRAREMLL